VDPDHTEKKRERENMCARACMCESHVGNRCRSFLHCINSIVTVRKCVATAVLAT